MSKHTPAPEHLFALGDEFPEPHMGSACPQHPATLSPPWLRSFRRNASTFFFDPAFDEQMRKIDTAHDEEVIRDLHSIRDILDESKAFVLPLETIEAPPPHQTSWRIANGVIAAIFVGVVYALLTGRFS